jgi:hypothetical protein
VDEHGLGLALDVVGRHEIAPDERGARPGAVEQSERGARSRPDLDRLVAPRGGDDVEDVALDPGVDADVLGDRLASGRELVAAQHGAERFDRLVVQPLPRGVGLDDAGLVGPRRVVDRDLHQEAVELRLGQRIRALELDGVLCREHREHRRDPVAHTVDRGGRLLHALEQRRLGTRRGAVDLVGEQQVREDRAGTELELLRLLVVDVGADEVGGHQVGRELDAPEARADEPRDRERKQRLAGSRDALEQRVAAGEKARQHLLLHLVLSEDHRVETLAQAAEAAMDVGECEHARGASGMRR